MADDVQLTDLEVVQRYSLAVRAQAAPRAEVVAALEADLAWLTGAGGPRRPSRATAPRRAPGAEPAPSRTGVRKAPARRTREA